MLKDKINKLFEGYIGSSMVDDYVDYLFDKQDFKAMSKILGRVIGPEDLGNKDAWYRIQEKLAANLENDYYINKDGKSGAWKITKTEGAGPADGNSGDSQSMTGSMTYESKETDDLWSKFDKEFKVKKDPKTGRVIPPKQKRKN